MKYRILHPEGFKADCFEGLQFPFIVQGKIIKSGTMKGWLQVTGRELSAIGNKSWRLHPDSTLEFSPAAFDKV